MRAIAKGNVKDKNALDASIPRVTTPAIISGVALNGTDTVQITFDTSVFKNRTPKYTAGVETVVSATEISATVIEVVFSGSVAGATMVVADGDLGVRTSAGGFVPAGNYAIPLT